MKLLVISHNPVSTYNAMGKTIMSFLDAFKKTEVCQLYIYPTYPSNDICSSFYRITDKDVLKSFLGGGLPGNRVKDKDIGQVSPAYESHRDQKLYTSSNNQRPMKRLLRDIMWGCSGWYNKKLRKWIESEKPDCLFVAGGDGKFLYNIALKISRKHKLPIVTYLCDEYYFIAPESGLCGRIKHALLKRKMQQFLSQSTHLIVISQEMKETYQKEFSVPVTTIMTGNSQDFVSDDSGEKNTASLAYIGNLGYGRYRPLADIGKCLDTINRKRGIHASLNVYSAHNDPKALEMFAETESIHFWGFASPEKTKEIMRESEGLIHVEDFCDRNIDLVKHSVSTKIADCLSCGTPLLAYGPEGIASMRHLARNHCALCVTDQAGLEEMLEAILFDAERKRAVVEEARKTAEIHHNRKANSLKFREIVETAVSQRSGIGVETMSG